MIIRSTRTQNFTIIPNLLLEDKNLDWKELGLLVFLLSKPDEWTVSVQHLAKQRKAGRDAILKSLKLLRDAGYVVMQRKHEGGVDYTIYDTPQKRETPLTENPVMADENQEPKPEKPLTENPTMGKATNGKSGHIVNTETTTSTEKERVSTESKARTKKFTPPTPEEVQGFAFEKGLNLDGFFEYYASNGWKVGRNPMVDWRMAAHGWHKRQQQFGSKSPATVTDHNRQAAEEAKQRIQQRRSANG